MEKGRLPELRKFVAPEFVFGVGARHLAGQYARNLAARKILLVTDPEVERCGWTGEVAASLYAAGMECVVYNRVHPNPRDIDVREGVAVYGREQCDAIVAVGGGSVIDCAKGIGISFANRRDILEFEGVDRVLSPGPPLIGIPTTAGSSADVSQFCIILDSERRVKIAIVSKTIIPDAALIDPETTTTMSGDLTVHTGLDAMTHAIEAYVSNVNGQISDLFAVSAVGHIARSLEAALHTPEDLRARESMMLGSLQAGLAFSNAILGAVHSMSHSLGGAADLPHGESNAILLDHVIRWNFPAAPDRYREIARAVGLDVDGKSDEQVCDNLTGWLSDFKRRLGVTRTLSDFGIRREDLRQLSEMAALDPCMATNPREFTLEEIEAIYEQAL